MKIPKTIQLAFDGQVCTFCPFESGRQMVEVVMNNNFKKYPVKTRCMAGYVRDEAKTIFIETTLGKKQTMVARPQACVDENGV